MTVIQQVKILGELDLVGSVSGLEAAREQDRAKVDGLCVGHVRSSYGVLKVAFWTALRKA